MRYHGGKWRLAPWIISHFPEHRCYVEPYGGGASVLLRKKRSHAEIYNDLDGEVVNVFQVIRDHGSELVEKISLTAYSRVEFDLTYKRTSDPIEQARRTIARTFMGFGSNTFRMNSDGSIMRTGFRSNSSRSGTTPARDWKNYPDGLILLIERLRGVVLENRDAREVMLAHDSADTLHYVDPPYLASTRTDALADYRYEMNEEDHLSLSLFLNSLRGRIIVSGYPSKLYEQLFKGWNRVQCSALADGAAKRTEVLWLRNISLPAELDFFGG